MRKDCTGVVRRRGEERWINRGGILLWYGYLMNLLNIIASEGVDGLRREVVENCRPEEQSSEIRKAAWGKLFAGRRNPCITDYLLQYVHTNSYGKKELYSANSYIKASTCLAI